jgi:hypothetical protein
MYKRESRKARKPERSSRTEEGKNEAVVKK